MASKRRVFVETEVSSLAEVKKGQRFRMQPADGEDDPDCVLEWETALCDGVITADGVGAVKVEADNG